jgi:hypothetical protein
MQNCLCGGALACYSLALRSAHKKSQLLSPPIQHHKIVTRTPPVAASFLKILNVSHPASRLTTHKILRLSVTLFVQKQSRRRSESRGRNNEIVLSTAIICLLQFVDRRIQKLLFVNPARPFIYKVIPNVYCLNRIVTATDKLGECFTLCVSCLK